jgi:hypothetical protein
VVYDSLGKGVSVLRLHSPITSALLDGSRVVILSGRALGERDLLTGRALEHLVLPASFGKLILQDADGGLAAYTEGSVVHVVRFADRRDAAIWIPRLAQVQQVALTPTGVAASAQLSTFGRGETARRLCLSSAERQPPRGGAAPQRPAGLATMRASRTPLGVQGYAR